MAQCPNCSRQTMRTKDWACRWCGYPLLSGSFKEIPKTFQQLQEEGLSQAGAVAEPEVTPGTEPGIAPEHEPKHIKEPERAQGVEPEIKPLMEQEELTEEDEKEKEPVIEPEPEPEPEAEAIVLTVDDIFKAYSEDESAADERFVKKLLEVTGKVTMIDVKEILDTHYIRISGQEEDNTKSVKCMFDKKYAQQLKELQKGQQVTVRGTFDGSLIAIRMVNCSIIE
jgi:hypothetical protein